MNDVQQSMDLLIESMDDLQPILKRFGAYLRGVAKAKFQAEGPGWTPLAKSTIERLEHTKTSNVTSQGRLRASYVKKRRTALGKKSKRASKALGRTTVYYNVFSSGRKIKANLKAKDKNSRAEISELNRLYENPDSAVSGRFKNLTTAAKKIDRIQSGKSVKSQRAIDKHKLLGKLANSLSATTTKKQLTVQSKVDWSGVQNDGGIVGNNATLPGRPFLELEPKDLEVLAKIAQDYMLEKAQINKSNS